MRLKPSGGSPAKNFREKVFEKVLAMVKNEITDPKICLISQNTLSLL